jgi:hypothetical protein
MRTRETVKLDRRAQHRGPRARVRKRLSRSPRHRRTRAEGGQKVAVGVDGLKEHQADRAAVRLDPPRLSDSVVSVHPKASLHGVHGLIAVLDRQQSPTSLLHRDEGDLRPPPRASGGSPDAFPVRRLYLDFLEPDDAWDGGCRFRFMDPKRVRRRGLTLWLAGCPTLRGTRTSPLWNDIGGGSIVPSGWAVPRRTG